MPAYTLITPPPVEPISLAEAKAHLRVDHTDDDAMIEIYIRAAREYVEGPYGFLGRALVTQTWRLTLDEFPDNEIQILLPPLQSVVNIYYDDSAGNEQTIDSDLYYVDTVSQPGWVVPIASASWPTPLDAINAVRIDFVAGYPVDTGASPPDYTVNIPFNIKAGMLLMIGNMFENRNDNIVGMAATPLPNGAEFLFRPHRIQLPMA
jgi:uncharacterized phiE125 gp8 family phage protein